MMNRDENYDKVTVIVPTYNEIDGLKTFLPLVKKEWYDQLIIIDGNSTDGTVEYAKEMGYTVYTQKSFGLKNAYIEIYDKVENGIVVAFSPDGNSIPDVIPQLVAKVKEGNEMVIASRYKDGAKSYDDTLVTGFGNWMFTSLINLFHNASYTDAMVMYRGWRKNVFYDLDLHKHSTYWQEKLFFTDVCIMPIFSIRAAKRKIAMAEIGADEPARDGGVQKLQIIRWGLAYLTQVITEKFMWK